MLILRKEKKQINKRKKKKKFLPPAHPKNITLSFFPFIM